MKTKYKKKYPVAKKVPKITEIHGDTLKDNYFWMRLSDQQKEAKTPDSQTTEVLDYLNAENNYTKEKLKNINSFEKQLFDEMVARIKPDDTSVPIYYNYYNYYRRFEKDQDYPLYCRKKNEEGAVEEIILDVPKMAKGYSYFHIGGKSIANDNNWLAYSVDTVSRRQYTVYFKNLSTNEVIEQTLTNTCGYIVWANDNKTVFYVKKDSHTLRPSMIYKHILGTDQSDDVLVYEEKNPEFYCGIYKTKSKKYIIIHSNQTISSEYRYILADKPNQKWKVFQSRQRGLEYSVDHYDDAFYIITNNQAKNFRLMKTDLNKTELQYWEEVIPHRDDVLLENIDIFKNYLVVSERIQGLTQLRVIPWNSKDEYYIPFDDKAFSAGTYENIDLDTDCLRFEYTSLTTPHSIFDFNLKTKEKELKKQQAILGGDFSVENYISERFMVEVRDGAKVPVSLVYHKDTPINSNTPLLLYGYGSYGHTIDPFFNSSRLSLLDRGFIFAIAHIRGGEELGRKWYEDGKLLCKKNTFYDFIDCGKYLIEKGYTSASHLYGNGASAGGLLVGAVANIEPKIWNGIIAEVPFVDVLNTMLDESIPLTTGEFDEWGNPKNKDYYEYIKSYSPYDNIVAQDYPNILITTGYWDSQVQYWEPAKWIAKLRDYKTDNNLLLIRCDMEVGHGGHSGRFKQYKDEAFKYAFLLNLEGIDK